MACWLGLQRSSGGFFPLLFSLGCCKRLHLICMHALLRATKFAPAPAPTTIGAWLVGALCLPKCCPQSCPWPMGRPPLLAPGGKGVAWLCVRSSITFGWLWPKWGGCPAEGAAAPGPQRWSNAGALPPCRTLHVVPFKGWCAGRQRGSGAALCPQSRPGLDGESKLLPLLWHLHQPGH